ncbi:hypothetical protein WHR41_06367 [Cladosporium halotolerans]|uniref:Uncharacterized protein n=1 Tax=Cladosporium halotolerans TaxID=1052096 RepID=A0AB34KLG3_9PEZI
MAYIFYSLTFLFLIVATVLYLTRALWKPHAPPIPYLTAPGPIPAWLYNLHDSLSDSYARIRYSRLPTSWQGDAEAGLHSSNFDLAENIEASDSRAGLDENAKRDVYVIMKRRGVGFDEARRIYVEGVFGRQGVGADGRPMDRKAVMFS